MPAQQGSFLYADSAPFSGEAALLLEALEISTEGKSREAVLSEFQKRGLLLTHVLECPLEGRLSTAEISGLLERQSRQTLVRIRRSLKPKRVLIFSKELSSLAAKLNETDFDAPLLLDDGKPFDLYEHTDSNRFVAFRQAMNREFSLQK